MTAQPVSHRIAELSRATSESQIELSLDLDGTGKSSISTSVPFFDHLLTAFAKHSLTDLTVRATGDTHIDAHHTVEDVSIVLGQAIRAALGDKSGIARYGDALVPLDEAALMRLFDLTPAEAGVALALITGRSIAQIVAARGVSRNTVRTQLAGILRKTGTHRQSELVRLLHLLPSVDLERAGAATPTARRRGRLNA